MTRDTATRVLKSLLLGLALIVSAGTLVEGKASTIVLKLTWAKKFRNQLSIDAQVTVLALNKGKEDDGDSHGGSRVNAAGLPMVAEILNGTAPAQAAARAKLAPGGQPKKAVYGAWRLWFEHPPPGGATQCQVFTGQPAAICDTQPHGADSNPSHSFEIHPVFAVDGIAIGRTSLVLTADNESVKDTDKAFADYTGTNKILTIGRSSTALTLTMISVQNNYVLMKVRVTHVKTSTTRQKDGTVDGGFVLADILSSSDEHVVLRPNARIFYFKDSEPGDALNTAAVGDEFTVIGMPRMDLDAVLRGSEGKQTTSFKVPFEFIIVAMG
jgi:hypothetical protein